jgi:hypothetical protein
MSSRKRLRRASEVLKDAQCFANDLGFLAALSARYNGLDERHEISWEIYAHNSLASMVN